MARVSLEKYFSSLFSKKTGVEEIKEINRAHAISSDYYDVQFGRNNLIYRDQFSQINVEIEYDVNNIMIIHINSATLKNCNIEIEVLKKRISNILQFLKVVFIFE